ncbi:unnamed protein product [Protopolystoma xenopodis]|uniref:Uncharacterized protein n=1 Tax=Protopolystoma xenopodis TaxID=117903 RepID=A0A448X7C6_9PLAT|nr:unnamed protein product [Protopolystoma xenopodis]
MFNELTSLQFHSFALCSLALSSLPPQKGALNLWSRRQLQPNTDAKRVALVILSGARRSKLLPSNTPKTCFPQHSQLSRDDGNMYQFVEDTKVVCVKPNLNAPLLVHAHSHVRPATDQAKDGRICKARTSLQKRPFQIPLSCVDRCFYLFISQRHSRAYFMRKLCVLHNR